MPAAGEAGQGERGEGPDKLGAQRRREKHAAVERPMPSDCVATVPDRHFARSLLRPVS